VGKGHWQESEHGQQGRHKNGAKTGLRAFEDGEVGGVAWRRPSK
jgi:hypothetical protein